MVWKNSSNEVNLNAMDESMEKHSTAIGTDFGINDINRKEILLQ